MKRVLVTTIISLIIFMSLPSTAIFAELPEFPKSEEVYIIEGTSKSLIVDQNSNKELEMGDLTDLMVAKVTLDTLQGKLSDQVEITKEDLKSLGPDETGIFVEGQSLSYQDLLNIMLLTSNDNASKLLGFNIGRKISGKDDVDDNEALNSFIEKLNETCEELKLSNTKFTDISGEKNTSTPVDLATLTQSTLGDKTIESIVNSSDYEVKIVSKKDSDQSKQKESEKTEDEEESEKEQVITIENKNSYLLSVINSGQDISPEEETNSSEENIEEKSIEEKSAKDQDSVENSDAVEEKNEDGEDSTLMDEETSSPEEESVNNVAYQVNSINDVKETSATAPVITTGYFANKDSDKAIGVFLTNINNAQVYGALSNTSDSEIGTQIDSVVTELKNNYSFIDLSNNEVITSKYKLENAHFSSPKEISLSGIDSLKAYMPTSNAEPETKVVWNEDYVKPTGENYQLVQSLEPLTQIATLEIKVGDQTQSLPLYNTDKVTVRNWTDSLLKYGLISIVVLIILLILWRLIYVHNRRKVLRRKRQRRLQRKRQMQARQLALQQGRNQTK